MEERADIKRAEMQFLAKAYERNPELFAQRTFVEDADTLSEFGIHIPNKETCPVALLKLWPEDFIVEEVSGNTVCDVAALPGEPSGEGPTVYATLIKCGISTIEAVDDIAAKLGVKVENVAYAGIKDKDALTAQRISIRGASASQVAALSGSHFYLADITLGQGALNKGALSGNRFTIYMRPEASFFTPEHLAVFDKKIEAVERFGFYNFYYLQRFGTPRLHNFAWALMILKGEYEQAVHDILTYEGERELPYFIELRRGMGKVWGRWDEILKILEPLPIVFRNELRIVRHLALHPGDYRGALQAIPEQVTLWMYALSSLLFNQCVSNYLLQGKEPPDELPLILSRERRDHEPYRDMLEGLGVYPLSFEALKPFPQVLIKSRTVPTRDKATVRKAEVVDDGVVLQFELGKGQYATTFLAHLFTLTAGALPQDISRARIDTKAHIGETSLAQVLERFAPVIQPKGDNLFEQMLEKGE